MLPANLLRLSHHCEELREGRLLLHAPEADAAVQVGLSRADAAELPAAELSVHIEGGSITISRKDGEELQIHDTTRPDETDPNHTETTPVLSKPAAKLVLSKMLGRTWHASAGESEIASRKGLMHFTNAIIDFALIKQRKPVLAPQK